MTIVLGVVLALTACSTKRKVVAERHTTYRVDTTKIHTDSVSVRATEQVQATEAVIYEDSTYIVFAPSGGVVQVDSAGRITMQGVVSMRTTKKHTTQKHTAISSTYSADSLGTRTAVGMTDSTIVAKETAVTQEGAKFPTWGRGVMIAVMVLAVVVWFFLRTRDW